MTLLFVYYLIRCQPALQAVLDGGCFYEWLHIAWLCVCLCVGPISDPWKKKVKPITNYDAVLGGGGRLMWAQVTMY